MNRSFVLRRLAALMALVCAASLACVGGSVARAATVPLSIRIVGNHFVNGANKTIRLLGVNHTSAEYACVDGYGYDDGHFDDRDARAIASWHANAVRVPLNEDCWLGVNGQPNSDQGADPKLTVAGYRREIENYVADLHRHGLYAILDLHWTAPGIQTALEQQPMPDMDHSPAFWSSVAGTFKSDKAVVFDLFNEPFDPTDPKSGEDADQDDKVTWNCWWTGTHAGPAGGTDCYTQAYDDQGAPTTKYRIAGLQDLLDAVRKAGARQPVLSGGLDYANDLGEKDHGGEWMNHAPDDPLNQEAASFHNYMGKACDNATCWKSAIAPIAKHVPVVTGEFDEDNYLQRKCTNKKASTFDASYMAWADATGVSYLAWGWIVESQQESDADGCSAFYLITDYSGYRPAAPNGSSLYNHLRALATPPPTVTLTAFGARMLRGDVKVGVTLRSGQTSNATVSGQTYYGHPKRLPLGTMHVRLAAGRTATPSFTISKSTHALLVASGSLKVTFTITLASANHRTTVYHRTVTLRKV